MLRLYKNIKIKKLTNANEIIGKILRHSHDGTEKATANGNQDRPW